MSALFLALGAAAFGLMALSDALTVLYKRPWGGRLFAAGGALLAAFALYTALDALYVLWQDRVIFPVSIEHYAAYRRSTPFLLPTAASLRRCLATLSVKSNGKRTDPKG